MSGRLRTGILIMKKTIFLFLLLIGYAETSSAQLFGPRNYEDCIIEGMQGVASDVAAVAVRSACREKFSVAEVESGGEQLTSDELANIRLDGGNWEKRYLSEEYDIDETIYNGNGFGIKRVVIKYTVSTTSEQRPEFINPFAKSDEPRRGLTSPLPDGFVLDGIELGKPVSFELMFVPYDSSCIRAKSISTDSQDAFRFPPNVAQWTHGVVSAVKC
jgi:hypothetical protein